MGACKNGEKHGWGVFTEPLYGRTYEGNYVKGKRQGLGCQTWTTPGKRQQIYDGMWQKDEKTGYGVLYVGREHFEGNFNEDNIDGFCKYQKCKESRDFKSLEGTWNLGRLYGINLVTN